MKIPVEEVYGSVLELLKKRTKIIKEEYKEIPYELKFLAYFMDLKKEDYEKILILSTIDSTRFKCIK